MSTKTSNPVNSPLYDSKDETINIDGTTWKCTLACSFAPGSYIRLDHLVPSKTNALLLSNSMNYFNITNNPEVSPLLFMMYKFTGPDREFANAPLSVNGNVPNKVTLSHTVVKSVPVVSVIEDIRYQKTLRRVYAKYVIRTLLNDTSEPTAKKIQEAVAYNEKSPTVTKSGKPAIGLLSEDDFTRPYIAITSTELNTINQLALQYLVPLINQKPTQNEIATKSELAAFSNEVLQNKVVVKSAFDKTLLAGEYEDIIWLAPPIAYVPTLDELDALAEPGATRIGLTAFTIPPDKITYSHNAILTSQNSGVEQMLRSGDSIVKSKGQSVRTIDFHFDAVDTISINKVILPLLRQFYKAPFLPIENDYINETLNIDAIALCNIQVKTVQGYPDQLDVTLSAEEFNWKSYMPGEESLDSAFCYPLLKLWANYKTSTTPIGDQGFNGKFGLILPDEDYLEVMSMNYSKSGKISPEFNEAALARAHKQMVTIENYFFNTSTDPVVKEARKQDIADDYPTGAKSLMWSMRVVPNCDLTSVGQAERVDIILTKAATPAEASYYANNADMVLKLQWAQDVNVKSVTALGQAYELEGVARATTDEVDTLRESLNLVLAGTGDMSSNMTTFIYLFQAKGHSSAYKAGSTIAAKERKIYGPTNTAGSEFKNLADAQDPNVDIPMVDQVLMPSMIVESIEASTENLFARNAAHMMGMPNHQFLGRSDTILTVAGTITDPDDERTLVRLLDKQEYLTRRYSGLAGYEGYIRVKNEIAQLFGIDYVIPINCKINTVDGMPDQKSFTIMFAKYDKAQKVRSMVNELTPEANKTTVQVTSDTLFEHALRAEQIRKMMTGMELYPDLQLPTLSELREWVIALTTSEETMYPLLDAFDIDYDEFPWDATDLQNLQTILPSVPPSGGTGFAEPDFYCSSMFPRGAEYLDAIIHTSAGYEKTGGKVAITDEAMLRTMAGSQKGNDSFGRTVEIKLPDPRDKEKSRKPGGVLNEWPPVTPLTTEQQKHKETSVKPLILADMTTPQSSTGADISGIEVNIQGTPTLYDEYIQKASNRWGVPVPLIKAVIKQESGFRPDAGSSAGAQGLMQIMPATAKGITVPDKNDPSKLVPFTNLHDPEDSIMAGTRYLRSMLDRTKYMNSPTWTNEDLALAAYNAGLGAVKKHNGVPPYKETQDYVKKVAANKKAFGVRSIAEETEDLCKKMYEKADLPYEKNRKFEPITNYVASKAARSKVNSQQVPFKLLVWSTRSKKTVLMSVREVDATKELLKLTLSKDLQVYATILPDGKVDYHGGAHTGILTLRISPVGAGFGNSEAAFQNTLVRRGLVMHHDTDLYMDFYAYVVPVNFKWNANMVTTPIPLWEHHSILDPQVLSPIARKALSADEVARWMAHPEGCTALQYLYFTEEEAAVAQVAGPAGVISTDGRSSYLNSVDPTGVWDSSPGYYPYDEMFINESLDPITEAPNYDHHRDMWHDTRKFSVQNRLVGAFPTYALLLVDGGSWLRFWRLYDHLFGLTTVQSIEVFKSRKQPADVATISLANPYGKLTKEPHWPFRETDRHWTLAYVMGAMQNALTGTWNQDELNRWNALRNSLLLKPGSRIHLRMGYGSNAHRMPVVFNGTITDVAPGTDIVEISALGDGAQLSNKLVTNATDAEGKSVYREHSMFGAGTNPRDVILGIMAPATPVNVMTRGSWDNANPHGIANFGSPTYGFKYKTSAEVGINIYAVTSDAVNSNKNVIADSSAFGNAVQALNIIPGYGVINGNNSQYMTAISMEDASAWDVFTTCRRVSPGYICAVHPFGLESRLFFGKPYWPMRYDYRSAIVGREENTVKFSLGEHGCVEIDKFNYLRPENLDYITEWKPFQQMHVISSFTNLIANGITASSEDIYTMCQTVGSYNGTFAKDGKDDWSSVKYLDTDILPEHQKMLYVTNGLYSTTWQKFIDGIQTLKPLNGLFTRQCSDTYTVYALRDSIMDMYKGSTLIMGDPSIKPHDLCFISDVKTEMQGMFGVKEVIHLFSWDTGLVSMVTPDLLAEPTEVVHQVGWEWSENIALRVVGSMACQGVVGSWLQSKGLLFKTLARIQMRITTALSDLKTQSAKNPAILAAKAKILQETAAELGVSIDMLNDLDTTRSGVTTRVLDFERNNIFTKQMTAGTRTTKKALKQGVLRASRKKAVATVVNTLKTELKTMAPNNQALLDAVDTAVANASKAKNASANSMINAAMTAANKELEALKLAPLNKKLRGTLRTAVAIAQDKEAAILIKNLVPDSFVNATREKNIATTGDALINSLTRLIKKLGTLTDELNIKGQVVRTRWLNSHIITPLANSIQNFRNIYKLESGMLAVATKLAELRHAKDVAAILKIQAEAVELAKGTGLVKWLREGGRGAVFSGAVKLSKFDVAIMVFDGISTMYNRWAASRQCLLLKPLTLNGREFTAGINGHLGCVVGDHMGFWDGVIRSWTNWEYAAGSTWQMAQNPGSVSIGAGITQGLQGVVSTIGMLLGFEGPNYDGTVDGEPSKLPPAGKYNDAQLKAHVENNQRFFAVQQGLDTLPTSTVDDINNDRIEYTTNELGQVVAEQTYNYQANECSKYVSDLLIREGYIDAETWHWRGAGSLNAPTNILGTFARNGHKVVHSKGDVTAGMLVHVQGAKSGHWFVTYKDDGVLKCNEASLGRIQNSQTFEEMMQTHDMHPDGAVSIGDSKYKSRNSILWKKYVTDKS